MKGPEFRASKFRRWLPAAVLAAAILAAYFAGLHNYLSLASISEHRVLWKDFAASHLVSAVLIFMLVYIAVVALSLPGAALMSVTGGFLFGWWLSAPVTVVAATLGAIIVFQVVKTSLGATLAERAGPMVRKLSDGFAKDAFNYILFLRLVPAFPFFAVNAVAGLSRVGLGTFALATVIGIIPAAIAFAYLGTGLDSLIDAQTRIYQDCVAEKGAANCEFRLHAHALMTREIIIAFVILGVVALIPIGLKFWKRGKMSS